MKVLLPPYVHSWPAPAVLVGCGTVEKPNLISIAWFGSVCSEPPMVSISIRPSRHSYGLIQESGEFTINLPRASEVKAVELCGAKSGRKMDKFKELGLTAVPCPPLANAPMVDEFFLSLGCRVVREIPLGTHHVFISEVVCVYCDEHLRRPTTGRANPLPEEQIVWMDGKYWGIRKL